MCNLNSKGDLTLKLLNLDLFYKGVTPRFCAMVLSNSKCHISAHIWDIGKISSTFNFSWIFLSKTVYKIGSFKSLKFKYEWRQQMWVENDICPYQPQYSSCSLLEAIRGIIQNHAVDYGKVVLWLADCDYVGYFLDSN